MRNNFQVLMIIVLSGILFILQTQTAFTQVNYEGDNDIGQKIKPEVMIKNSQVFVDRVHQLWSDTVILYLL